MSQVNRALSPRLEPPGHPSQHIDHDGRLSAQSIRSLTAFSDTTAGEEGAFIPDIPFQKSNKELTAADFITSPPLPRRSFRKPRFMEDLDTRRVINPNSVQLHTQRAMPPRPSVGEDLDSRMASPEYVEDLHDAAESRSPSTAPKSLMSKSTNSRINSSASSLAGPPVTALSALQVRGAAEHDGLEPLAEEEIDPASFDLVVPAHALGKQYSLEAQSELLFSAKHLGVIFEDPVLLQRFTNFIYRLRPKSVPVLLYYMDALKALKAISYANAVVDGLRLVDGLEYTADPITRTVNHILKDKANKAFETLANHDLPAYITHTYIQTVSVTIKRRISNTLPAQLREMSEGLAEVFCLTDPSRPDNPIVFASEEFHRTTQYGMSYVLGRNCRFLQGPKTNQFSVKRLREKLDAGVEHCETFLNYRRDGSPFMNLLMVAPLYDSRGAVRYHIGAQVDVSGLVKDNSGLESLERLIERENPELAQVHRPRHPTEGGPVRMHGEAGPQEDDDGKKDEFRELAEMFSLGELKTVRECGGALHRVHQEDMQGTEGVTNWHKPRLTIRDDATLDRRDSDPVLNAHAHAPTGGRLSGVYENYLLVRPYPSLRVLFASPSLRVPGMLQSNLMDRIGGTSRVREAIAQAFADGHGVTAKVRWITRAATQGRPRWIHCTPLLGSNGAVGVWMVVLVDEEGETKGKAPRDAPPVERYIKRINFHPESVDDLSSWGGSIRGSIGGGGSPAGAHRRTPAVDGNAQFGANGYGGRPFTPDTVRFDSL
ncbi:hypothetical protein BJ170DRAFT_638913 [Xylariales sp. AK1849]|nr:hypothetical protein BJ170DRAFT_638913 [Xylariales sp. AK1849]